MIAKCPENKEPVVHKIIVAIDLISGAKPYGKSTRVAAIKDGLTKFIQTLPIGVTDNEVGIFLPSMQNAVTSTSVPLLTSSVNAITAGYGNDPTDVLTSVLTYFKSTDLTNKRPLLIYLMSDSAMQKDPSVVAQQLKDLKCRIIVIDVLDRKDLAKKAYFSDTLVGAAHKSIATTSNYYAAYDLDLINLLSVLPNEIQECVDKVVLPPDAPPDAVAEIPPKLPGIADLPDIAKQTKECKTDCGSGWTINRNDGQLTASPCGGLTINNPPTVPKDQVSDEQQKTAPPTERDVPSRQCTNLIKNGDFENVLDSWVVDRNDGKLDIVADSGIKSIVYHYQYSGTKSDVNCVQVVNNPEFNDLSYWTPKTADGYVAVVNETACGSQLLMSRTLNRKHWIRCETQNVPPICQPITRTIEYPCINSNTLNVVTINIMDYVQDIDGDAPPTLTAVSNPVSGTVSVAHNTVTYVPPTTRLADNQEVIFTYTVTDDRQRSSTSTITIHCNCPPPIVAQDFAKEFNCPCSINNWITIDLLQHVVNPTKEQVIFDAITDNGHVGIDNNILTFNGPLSLNTNATILYTATSVNGQHATGTITITCVMNKLVRNFTIYCATTYVIDLLDTVQQIFECVENWVLLSVGTPTTGSLQVTDDRFVTWTGQLADRASFDYILAYDDKQLTGTINLLSGQTEPICVEDTEFSQTFTYDGGEGTWNDLPDTWDELNTDWTHIIPVLGPNRTEYVTSVIDLGRDTLVVPTINAVPMTGTVSVSMSYGSTADGQPVSPYTTVGPIKCRYLRIKVHGLATLHTFSVTVDGAGTVQQVVVDSAEFHIVPGYFKVYGLPGIIGAEILKTDMVYPYSWELVELGEEQDKGFATFYTYNSQFILTDCVATILLSYR